MKKNRPTPIFSYEKKEEADEKEAGKAMLKIVKNALAKIYPNI